MNYYFYFLSEKNEVFYNYEKIYGIFLFFIKFNVLQILIKLALYLHY